MARTSPAAPTFANDIALPDPDKIREAIDVADERSRLLRRLLRVALRLQLHSSTVAFRHTVEDAAEKVVCP